MWWVGGGGVWVGDESVRVRVGGFVHADVPVWLAGYVPVGHGGRQEDCGGDEEGEGGKLSNLRGW